MIKLVTPSLLLFLITGCSATPPKVASIYSLDDAANFLMMISDEKPGLTNKCQLTSSEALRLMQPLHALIDQEKAPTRQTRFTLDLALQTSNWFCQSPLLKQLKSEVQSEPESTGL